MLGCRAWVLLWVTFFENLKGYCLKSLFQHLHVQTTVIFAMTQLVQYWEGSVSRYLKWFHSLCQNTFQKSSKLILFNTGTVSNPVKLQHIILYKIRIYIMREFNNTSVNLATNIGGIKHHARWWHPPCEMCIYQEKHKVLWYG